MGKFICNKTYNFPAINNWNEKIRRQKIESVHTPKHKTGNFFGSG
jgi:hypothetical protein